MSRIALLVPCYMTILRPKDVSSSRRVLEALGESVDEIKGYCCGQPAYNSGFRKEARSVGRKMLQATRNYETVVIPSGSCTSMIRTGMPKLFIEPQDVSIEQQTKKIWDFGEFVNSHHQINQVQFKMTGSIVYHDSCHGRRELGLTPNLVNLIQRIEGLDLRRLPHEEECCGFGGSFTVKQPEVSVAIARAKLEEVEQSGARILVSEDLSCLTHLQATAEGDGHTLETWTIAELLDRALND